MPCRDRERDFRRYLEYRYPDPEEEAVDPQYHIAAMLYSCQFGTREDRIVGFFELFEYLLTVPEFVNAHPVFREVAVAKARECRTEPPLVAVCDRVVAAYAPKG